MDQELLCGVACGSAGLMPGHKIEERSRVDWMLPEKHAIAILKKDHDKELFDKFEKTGRKPAREKLIR